MAKATTHQCKVCGRTIDDTGMNIVCFGKETLAAESTEDRVVWDVVKCPEFISVEFEPKRGAQ